MKYLRWITLPFRLITVATMWLCWIVALNQAIPLAEMKVATSELLWGSK